MAGMAEQQSTSRFLQTDYFWPDSVAKWIAGYETFLSALFQNSTVAWIERYGSR
jgi:hypothetical protein